MSQSIADDLARVSMSPNLTATLTRAANFARHRSHAHVSLEHLLMALIEDAEAALVLAACDINLNLVAAAVAAHLTGIDPAADQGGASQLSISPEFKRVLEAAAAAAQQGRRQVNGAIVLAAIVGDGKSTAAQVLRAHGLTFDTAIKALQRTVPAGQAQRQRPATPAPQGAVASRVTANPGAPAAEAAPPVTPAPTAPSRRPHALEEPPPADPAVAPPLAGPPPIPQPEVAPELAPEPTPTVRRRRPVTEHTALGSIPIEPPHEGGPHAAPATQSPPPAYAEVGTPGLVPQSGTPADAMLPPQFEPDPPGSVLRRGPSRDDPPQPMAHPAQREQQRHSVVPVPRHDVVRRPYPADASDAAGGQLIENIPRVMRADTPVAVEVRLVRRDQGPPSDLTDQPYAQLASRAMTVRITATTGDFLIETVRPETQWIEGPQPGQGQALARWHWMVTPLHHGQLHLQIAVSARWIGPEGLSAHIPLPEQLVTIDVHRDYGRIMVRMLGWLGVLVAGGVLTVVGRWILQLLMGRM